jgi:hypothetical protein
MGGNWRPDYDPKTVHAELSIIKNDMHCNAVNISGQDIGRVARTAEDALNQGLEVWLSATLWNRSPKDTMEYTVRAAMAAQKLQVRWPGRIVFSVGVELTLFMQGIVEGKGLMKRLRNFFAGARTEGEKRSKLLNDYLDSATRATREVFAGPVACSSLIAEAVDWKKFDYVGVDHYWSERIKDRYVDMLKPLFSSGKPVVVTGFGFGKTSAPPIGVASTLGNVNHMSQFLHQLPVVGALFRPRLNVINERDERAQAKRLVDTLSILDEAGVSGAFVSTFIFPLDPYSDVPRYDLDRESESLVRYYGKSKHGATYPGMMWEPKESFRVVAEYYKSH